MFMHSCTLTLKVNNQLIQLHCLPDCRMSQTVNVGGGVMSSIACRLFRRKSMARESLELSTSQLARVLTVWDLTALVSNVHNTS